MLVDVCLEKRHEAAVFPVIAVPQRRPLLVELTEELLPAFARGPHVGEAVFLAGALVSQGLADQGCNLLPAASEIE